METFPTTNPRPNKIESTEHTYNNTEVVFEKQGYAQYFKNRNNDKQTFTLFYDHITAAEKNTLVLFFQARKGRYERFYFYNHVDGVTYTVRFADDKFPITHENSSFFSLTIKLKEA